MADLSRETKIRDEREISERERSSMLVHTLAAQAKAKAKAGLGLRNTISI